MTYAAQFCSSSRPPPPGAAVSLTRSGRRDLGLEVAAPESMARGGYNANAPLNRTAEGTAKPDPSLGVLWRLRQGGRRLLGPALEELLGGRYVEGAGEQEALSVVAVLVL